MVELLSLSPLAILYFVIISIGILLGGLVGVGGASTTIPLLIVLFHINSNEAIVLGNISVLGSSMISFLFFFYQRHPFKPIKPIIDWDAILMLEPPTLFGAICGAYIHHLLPIKITQYLLVFVLSIVSIRIIYKGMRLFLRDSQRQLYTELNTNTESNNEEILESKDCELSDLNSLQSASFDELARSTISSSSSIHEISLRIPWRQIIYVVILIAGICSINLFKTTMNFYCWDIFANTILVVFVILMGVFLRNLVNNESEVATKLNDDQISFVDSDIDWKSHANVIYPMLCFIAGVIAGCLGIGGGIIKGPILLELGLSPYIVSATSTSMVFMTSIITVSSYFMYRNYGYQKLLLLFLIGVVSSATGQLIHRIISIKESALTILMGIIIGVSGILVVSQVFI